MVRNLTYEISKLISEYKEKPVKIKAASMYGKLKENN